MASGGRLGEVKMASGGFRHRVCSLSLLLLLFLYSYLGGEPGSGLAAGAIYPPGLEWDGWMDGRGANKPRGGGHAGQGIAGAS